MEGALLEQGCDASDSHRSGRSLFHARLERILLLFETACAHQHTIICLFCMSDLCQSEPMHHLLKCEYRHYYRYHRGSSKLL